MHLVHLVDPSTLAIDPAGHSVQISPALLYSPFGHLMHADAAFDPLLELVPAGQLMQVSAPSVSP
jgi:hypothetical protein